MVTSIVSPSRTRLISLLRSCRLFCSVKFHRTHVPSPRILVVKYLAFHLLENDFVLTSIPHLLYPFTSTGFSICLWSKITCTNNSKHYCTNRVTEATTFSLARTLIVSSFTCPIMCSTFASRIAILVSWLCSVIHFKVCSPHYIVN